MARAPLPLGRGTFRPCHITRAALLFGQWPCKAGRRIQTLRTSARVYPGVSSTRVASVLKN
eukprot:scaffold40106_cov57-Phaeocystis_antarctica.AAC.2